MAKMLIYAKWVFGVLLITFFMVSITVTVGGILRKHKKINLINKSYFTVHLILLKILKN